jgi:hypothetical protein
VFGRAILQGVTVEVAPFFLWRGTAGYVVVFDPLAKRAMPSRGSCDFTGRQQPMHFFISHHLKPPPYRATCAAILISKNSCSAFSTGPETQERSLM